MNVWNVVKMNRLADKLYQAGFPYGAWVVRLDAAGLFPVCELLFLTEEPTEALLRERFGARLLRFARFDAHHPPAR